MIITKSIKESSEILVVSPTPVEIVYSEGKMGPLSFIMPPIEDLNEIKKLKSANYSVNEHSVKARAEREQALGEEYKNLLSKKNRFANSIIYFNRLANIASALGNHQLELSHLESAKAIRDDTFFRIRIGESLLSGGSSYLAEKAFFDPALDTSPYAQLWRAYFKLQERDIDGASKFVDRALELDPLDFSARLFIGALQILNGQYNFAIRNLRVAIEEKPNSSATYANLGFAYSRLRNREKAVKALITATELDPLNESAALLLADLTFAYGTSEIAIKPLLRLVEFEQKKQAIWERLARALFLAGRQDECVAALKRQASINESPSVWNNIGAAYSAGGSPKKAIQAFKHAMLMCTDEGSYEFLHAGRNISAIMKSKLENDEIYKLTTSLISGDKNRYIFKHNSLSDIVVLRINSIFKRRDYDLAADICEQILQAVDANRPLKDWAISHLLAYYALSGVRLNEIPRLVALSKERIYAEEKLDENSRSHLINNMAYALTEYGDITQAEHYLSLLSSRIHVDAYPTATLGLICLRKGKNERGSDLYKEAIGLAKTKTDKMRIRQKLFIELGRLRLNESRFSAARYFEKACGILDGEEILRAQATQLLRDSKRISRH